MVPSGIQAADPPLDQTPAGRVSRGQMMTRLMKATITLHTSCHPQMLLSCKQQQPHAMLLKGSQCLAWCLMHSMNLPSTHQIQILRRALATARAL